MVMYIMGQLAHTISSIWQCRPGVQCHALMVHIYWILVSWTSTTLITQGSLWKGWSMSFIHYKYVASEQMQRCLVIYICLSFHLFRRGVLILSLHLQHNQWYHHGFAFPNMFVVAPSSLSWNMINNFYLAKGHAIHSGTGPKAIENFVTLLNYSHSEWILVFCIPTLKYWLSRKSCEYVLETLGVFRLLLW